MRRSPAFRSIAMLAVALIVAAACGGGGGTGTAPTAAPAASPTAVAAVQPTRATEFVIQTGPGGSSDIYARFWISIMDKERLVPQPVQPVNKEGGAGAVAFTYVFEKRGDPHYLMVTLNSFWTTIITQRLPYKTTDFTPIVNMALDPFFLWVHADSPIRTAGDFVTAAKAKAMIASGTGAKQEDEVLFRRIQELGGTQPFTYVPQSGGGAVAAALAGKQGGVEVTVNNPSEARSLAGQGRLRAICAFTPESPKEGTFKDLPTCKSQGLAIDDYYNVRAVVGPPGMSAGAQKFWIDTFRKINDHADWKKFLTDNALDPDFRSGDDFRKLIEQYQKIHEEIAAKYNWVQ
ncbi:MAG: Bug family tripartite tricarboxylate transporter substrate binding protein [Thermoleophilaceae bacterium]